MNAGLSSGGILSAAGITGGYALLMMGFLRWSNDSNTRIPWKRQHKVQELIDRRPPIMEGNACPFYNLFHGIIYCATCGKSMQVRYEKVGRTGKNRFTGAGAGTGGKPEAAKRIDPFLAPFQWAGKWCPYLYPGNPAVCHDTGIGRGYLKPPYQPDSGGGGEKDWRGELTHIIWYSRKGFLFACIWKRSWVRYSLASV